MLDVSEDTVLTAGQVLAAVTPTLATNKVGCVRDWTGTRTRQGLITGVLLGVSDDGHAAQAVASPAQLARVQRGRQAPADH